MSIKKMYKKMPALLKRTMWAKTLGSIVSLLGFIAIVWTGNYTNNQMLAWGVLFWYPLVGVMIGLAGTMDKHPLLGKMGIWRGVMLGAMMNFVLVLFAAGPIIEVLSDMGFAFSPVTLVWAAVLEGAIIGGAIDWYVTARFGEGKKLLKK